MYPLIRNKWLMPQRQIVFSSPAQAKPTHPLKPFPSPLLAPSSARRCPHRCRRQKQQASRHTNPGARYLHPLPRPSCSSTTGRPAKGQARAKAIGEKKRHVSSVGYASRTRRRQKRTRSVVLENLPSSSSTAVVSSLHASHTYRFVPAKGHDCAASSLASLRRKFHAASHNRHTVFFPFFPWYDNLKEAAIEINHGIDTSFIHHRYFSELHAHTTTS